MAWSFVAEVEASSKQMVHFGSFWLGSAVAVSGCMALSNLPHINEITSLIIKAAIEVHRRLGPGLFESVYIVCLVYELQNAGLTIRSEKKLPVTYKGIQLDCGFRLDMIVNELVIVEVKSVRTLAPIHEAQLLTYLKMTGCPAGLLINFKVPILKQGLKRLLNTENPQ
jgi:GxxExxY protein